MITDVKSPVCSRCSGKVFRERRLLDVYPGYDIFYSISPVACTVDLDPMDQFVLVSVFFQILVGEQFFIFVKMRMPVLENSL